MSNIEPTDEQKQAAYQFLADHEEEYGVHVPQYDLARLLAEREHKLRDELTKPCDPTVDMCGGCSACVHWYRERSIRRDRHIDTLRARVAELEAKQARLKHLANDEVTACGVHIDSLEKLLAASSEREAQHLARIAELEAALEHSKTARRESFAAAVADLSAAKAREAQHLADIKALRVDLSDAYDELYAVVRYDAGENYGGPYNVDNAERVRAQLARRILATAHYDDAKADAPAVDMQAWANGSCPEPGCSLANPHEQGAACVKPTAEGGEG